MNFTNRLNSKVLSLFKPDFEVSRNVGKIEIGKFVRIRTYMCISVHQLAGLFVGISNSPLDLQVASSVSALTAIDRTNDTAYTDVC